jgi:HUS1 checkpoint protein
LIQSVATLQKRCILRFTETTLHIICRDHLGGGSADPGGGGSGIEVWSQVKAASLFTDYRIQSNAGNEISLLLASDALLAALRAAAGADAHTVVMKLAKKHELAVLTIELTLHARLGADAVVAHDVRIEVQKPADMERLKEPLCPEPDVRMPQALEPSDCTHHMQVHILLPPLSKVRTTVERMRSLSDVIAFRANNRGRMQLAVRTDSVAVEIQWTSLTNPKMGTHGPLCACPCTLADGRP